MSLNMVLIIIITTCYSFFVIIITVIIIWHSFFVLTFVSVLFIFQERHLGKWSLISIFSYNILETGPPVNSQKKIALKMIWVSSVFSSVTSPQYQGGMGELSGAWASCAWSKNKGKLPSQCSRQCVSVIKSGTSLLGVEKLLPPNQISSLSITYHLSLIEVTCLRRSFCSFLVFPNLHLIV